MLKSLMSPSLPGGDFMIGDWIVSPSRNRIRRSSERVGHSIEPLLARFLNVLALRGGETVTKDELTDQVWNGVIVSDEAMAQAASRLRKALEDDPRNPRYVETVRKIGYRLAVPVEGLAEAKPKKSSLAIAAIGTATIGLVVAVAIFGQSDPPYDLTPVATDARDERRPAISPDGRQIAYEVTDSDGSTSIWVGNGKSGEAAVVPGTRGAEAPAWLSNRSLAMQIRRGPDCRLVAIDLGYRGAKTIGRCDGSGYADLTVSPDGRRLAFNAFGPDRNGPRAIHIVELGGADRRVTSPPVGSWGDYDPEFASDGRSLLFTRAASEGQQDLFLLEPNGRERRLTRRFGNIFGATWRSARQIVYSARSGGRFGLRTLDLDSGRDQPLALPISDAVDPVAKGSVLFVGSRQFRARLIGLESFPNSSGINLHPALSPDGQHLVFTSDRSGSLELWLFDRRGGELIQLTRHGGPYVGVPRFAPDGRTLVYEVRSGDDADLYILNLRTRRSRPLLRSNHFDTAPSFSADGRWVLFGSNRRGGWDLFSVAANGGGAPRAILADAFAAVEAPDGAALYFTLRRGPGLFRLDRASRRISTIDPAFPVEDWGAFAPVRGGVVFVQRPKPQQALIVLQRDDGERAVIVRPTAPIPSHDPVLAARSDLGEIVYAESDRSSGDIYRASR